MTISNTIRKLRNSVLALLCGFGSADAALAVTDYQAVEIPFTGQLAELKASVTPPVSDELEHLQIPLKKLKLRLLNPKKDPTIEPVALTLPRSETGLREIVNKLAAPGKKDELSKLLLEKIKKVGPSNRDSAKVEFSADDMKFLSLRGLSRELSKEHHKLTMKGTELQQSGEIWDELRDQLSFHLSKEQMSRLNRKVKSGATLEVDEDMLPAFSKKMVGKFIVYRGPNCFHAALSFYDQQLPRSPEVNVKEEEGYHRSMINYDELWRVISTQFYEVDPRSAPLKYGDLLVFFQVPQDAPKTINFKWIRHTSIYLFGPYTYSKGSKSPNSPYSVKTLEEEWNTWANMAKTMGMRVYRRQTTADTTVPQGRDSWIY